MRDFFVTLNDYPGTALAFAWFILWCIRTWRKGTLD
jgi:hypothetical protein